MGGVGQGGTEPAGVGGTEPARVTDELQHDNVLWSSEPLAAIQQSLRARWSNGSRFVAWLLGQWGAECNHPRGSRSAIELLHRDHDRLHGIEVET